MAAVGMLSRPYQTASHTPDETRIGSHLHGNLEKFRERPQVPFPKDRDPSFLGVLEVPELEDSRQHGGGSRPIPELASLGGCFPSCLAIQTLDTVRGAVADLTFDEQEPPIPKPNRDIAFHSDNV